MAAVAHEQGVPLVVDSTFATPYLLRPFEFGADIVCHSSTKYISGHGTTIGGIAVEKGGFDWGSGRFPQFERFIEENERCIDPEDLRHTAFTRRLRMRYLTELGGHMSPMTAFLTLQGVETLSLRMQRHADNAWRWLRSWRTTRRCARCPTRRSPRALITIWRRSTSRAAPARSWAFASGAGSRPRSACSRRCGSSTTW